jgi:hypothetical protein
MSEEQGALSRRLFLTGTLMAPRRIGARVMFIMKERAGPTDFTRASALEPDETRDELLQAADERLKATQGTRLDAITDSRPIYFAPDEPALLQHLQVLGYGRLCERQFVNYFSAYASVLSDQHPQNLNSGWMPYCLGESSQFLVRQRSLDGTQIRIGSERRAAFSV